MLLLSSADFLTLTFSKNYFRNAIRVSKETVLLSTQSIKLMGQKTITILPSSIKYISGLVFKIFHFQDFLNF